MQRLDRDVSPYLAEGLTEVNEWAGMVSLDGTLEVARNFVTEHVVGRSVPLSHRLP